MVGTPWPQSVPVLIVGAGTVGLSLAAELGWRGVDCLLVERSAGLNPHPRANAVANRTMEYFRRWGIDQHITEAGIGPDLPARYLWVSTLHGREIHRIELPGHNQLRDGQKRGSLTTGEHSWSPYLKTTTGQNHVEAALLDFVLKQPSVTVAFNTALDGFEQDATGVTTYIRQTNSDQTCPVRCQYLVGCDGGRSTVRDALGIRLEGRAGLAKFVSIYFRAAELPKQCPFGLANIYFPLHRDHCGFILNWDGGEEFTYHLVLKEDQNWEQINPREAICAVLGQEIPIDLISVQPWTAHALVAKRYREGRVFLAGDAAHLFTPTGGFGMNTGISDAIDLAWKLQACLASWGGETLLRSYELERRPIGLRNTREAADCFDRLYATMQYGAELDADSDASVALRSTLTAELKQQEKLISSSGTLLGYRYTDSPIIMPDRSTEPADDPRTYEPTARPGHRAPHCRLEDERVLYDCLSAGFTLLQLDPELDVSDLMSSADQLSIPLDHVQLDSSITRELYQCGLAIIRPDLMVAWRSDLPPADAHALLTVISGRTQADASGSGSAVASRLNPNRSTSSPKTQTNASSALP